MEHLKSVRNFIDFYEHLATPNELSTLRTWQPLK